jgi:SAM-dependent methyltransferase
MTAYLKLQEFAKVYIDPALENCAGGKVIEIGSKSYLDQPTCRGIMESRGLQYVGLDLEEGLNVDLVPKDTYVWSELGDEAFAYCISNATFEHNPFFWITFAEIARILVQGGMLMVIAPGRGRVHRFPFDCWRFYPDSWSALCQYCGLELVETFFEDYAFRRLQDGSFWCDSAVIARKPIFTSEPESARFYERLRAIAATLPHPEARRPEGIRGDVIGPCFSNYLKANTFSFVRSVYLRIKDPKTVFRRIFTHTTDARPPRV